MSGRPQDRLRRAPGAGRAPLLRRLIGAALRRVRQRQGRTLRDVARAADVSVPYLSELERGRKEASSEVLAAVCRALGLHLADLLDEVREELSRVDALPRAGALSRFEAAPERGRPAGRPSYPTALVRRGRCGLHPYRRTRPTQRRSFTAVRPGRHVARPFGLTPRASGAPVGPLTPGGWLPLSADFPTAEIAAAGGAWGRGFPSRLPG